MEERAWGADRTLVADDESSKWVRFTEEVVEGDPELIQSLYLPRWFVGSRKEVRITVAEVTKK